jgi:hypothetical protein
MSLRGLAVIFRNPAHGNRWRIRMLRMAKGQSLTSVALDAGTDGSNLSCIERGVVKTLTQAQQKS